MSWHPVGNKLVALIGRAQETANPRHAQVVAEKAQMLVTSGQYLYVGQNLSWRTMLANATNGARITGNRTRPDVIGVRYSNGEYFVDMFEYASGGQNPLLLVRKMRAGLRSVQANMPSGVVVREGIVRAFAQSEY